MEDDFGEPLTGLGVELFVDAAGVAGLFAVAAAGDVETVGEEEHAGFLVAFDLCGVAG